MLPSLVFLVASHEEGLVTFHNLLQERLVRFSALHVERFRVLEVHGDGSQPHPAAGLFCFEFEHDRLVGLDVDNHPVRLKEVGRGRREGLVRNRGEHDHDLG
jgi:hypothetical protein